MSKKDFSITVSLTGYRLFYKGTEIGGIGRMGWPSSIRGVAASFRRHSYALIADNEVKKLISGNGNKTLIMKIKNIENQINKKYEKVTADCSF